MTYTVGDESSSWVTSDGTKLPCTPIHSGTIAEKRGPLTYLVQIREDILWKRHIDQLIQAADTPDDVSSCASPFAPTVPVLPACITSILKLLPTLSLPHSPVIITPEQMQHQSQPAATNPVPITLSSTSYS